MPSVLTNLKSKTVSLIFGKGASGEQWAPRMQEAVTIAVKGGAVDEKSFLAPETIAKIKAASEAEKGLVDADAIADSAAEIASRSMAWDALQSLIGQVNYDMSLVVGAGDVFTDDERTEAFQRIMQAFAEAAVDLFPILLGKALVDSDDVAKAGKRHSKADQERIDKLGEHLDAAKKLHGELAGDAKPKGDETKPDESEKGGAEAAPAIVAAEPVVEQPAAAETTTDKGASTDLTVTVGADTAAFSAMVEQIGTMLTKAQADISATIDAKLAEHNAAVDAKLADATEKAKAEGETINRLKASVDAMVRSARQPTSPAGQPTFNGEGFKGAAMTESRETQVEIPANATALDATLAIVRAGREA